MKVIKRIIPYVAVVVSAFLFSYALRAFVNKSGLLTGGVSGVCLVLSRYIAIIKYNTNLDDLLSNAVYMEYVNNLTSILYFLINLPLIVLAFLKLGKKFAILSAVYIISSTVFIGLLPEGIMDIFQLGSDYLACALFAGALAGLAISLALNVGGSTGGLEIIAMYFSRKKQISIGKFSIVVNAIIIITGGILLQKWTPILFTLVYIFVSGRVVDALHRLTRKIVINIITTKHNEIADALSEKTHYSSTSWQAVGGYTKTDKQAMLVVVPENKVEKIITIVSEIDPDVFIVTMDSNKVYGNFYIEPIK